MPKAVRIAVVQLLILSLLLGSCATHKPRKLPKKGAIPCPVKDC